MSVPHPVSVLIGIPLLAIGVLIGLAGLIVCLIKREPFPR